MTHRPQPRRGALVLVLAALACSAPLVVATAALAQSVNCGAGAAGGAGGRGGSSIAGRPGLAIPGFGTAAGTVDARGATPGSARGGDGGRGGSGTLPVCNQNTNGSSPAANRVTAPVAGAAPPVVHGVTGAPVVHGAGGGLARTGSRTYLELGVAGSAFVVGGGFLLLGQPLRGTKRQ